MRLPIVAIVGRPNVGKSTLFNRLVGRRTALVDATAGVTRDRHYGEADWLGHAFCLIDTGGIVEEDSSTLSRSILLQTTHAITEADLIIFVLDAREGVTAADAEIAARLRKADKPVLLVANKVESAAIDVADTAFYRLGFGPPLCISAEHGRGIGDMLDSVMARLPKVPESPPQPTGIQVAIVGRPNVGKSSLVNYIAGETRLLVTDMPGTTRDAIDIRVRVQGKDYTLVDTAGMRKPRRIGVSLEKATVATALQSIRRCEVAVLLLDATDAIGEQDVRIGTYIERQGKACVIALNKWDAVPKDTGTFAAFVARVHAAMPFWSHVPLLSLSALSGQRVSKLFPLIDRVYEETRRRVTVAELNTWLHTITQQRSAPTYRGTFIKFSFVMQTTIRPPTFICFTNRPEGVAPHYQRYMENQLRRHFGFVGTPIRLYFRKK